MSLSYSAITNYGKVTLPSVEAGLGSMNVLRTPNSGIYTRKKDKLSQTSDLTQMLQDSGDRACEYITHFARSVNPMVSVSYDNNGNNGGQSYSGTRPAAFNPYSLGAAGFEFRPPVLTPQDLVPLSRLHRNITTMSTNPEFIDFSKKLTCAKPADKTREVHTMIKKISIVPNSRIQMETPIKEPFEIKYVIQNPIKMTNMSSGMRTMDITSQDNKQPLKNINNDILQTSVYANLNDNRHYIDNNKLYTDKYIQDALQKEVMTNSSKRLELTPINEIMDLDVDMFTKDTHNIEYTSPYSGNGDYSYIHSDIIKDRKTPNYSAISNIQDNRYVNNVTPIEIILDRKSPLTSAYSNYGTDEVQINSNDMIRDYYLPPKVKKGGFDNQGGLPSTERLSQLFDDNKFESDRVRLHRKAFEQMDGRYR